MTRSVHFTEFEMSRLVDIYKDYACLWNPKHEAYRDNQARLTAYKEIMEKLNIPNLTVKDVPIKIKNLRSSYYQEIKRIRRSIRAGGVEYKPKVSWFKTLNKLLKPFVYERQYATKTPIREILRKEKNVANPIQVEPTETDNYTERVTPRNKPEDEFDSFGKYIATTLRSMPAEYSIIAKTEVQKTLSEIQLKILRKEHADGSINHQQQHVQSQCYGVSTMSENDNQNAECTSHSPDSWYSCIIKTETVHS